MATDRDEAGSGVVGLVLSGGGARGAYEIGVLSALLPALARRGERPTLIVGTSIGAMNAAYLAATADEQDVGQVLAGAERKWVEIDARQIWRRPFAPHALRLLASYVAQLWGTRGGPWSILDPKPTPGTIDDIVPFERLHANIASGRVRVAVVTTSAFTSKTVVFHGGGPTPCPDARRGISYRPTPRLGVEHVQASLSIPGAFPAGRIEAPERDRGWYFDGGVRLNTPIKPAIALGADRILVIGVNSISIGEAPVGDPRPDLFDGLGQVVQATLSDPFAGDIYTLAHDNRIVAEAEAGGVTLSDRRLIPYAFVAPEQPDTIGRIAQEVFSDHFPLTRALRGDEIAVLGRLLGAGEDPLHGELFSYIFFAEEFTSRLIDLGKSDGERWLELTHDDGPWRIGSDPPS